MLLPTCVIKLLELMLSVACLTLHHYSYDLTDVSTLMLCSGTYVGYVVVLSGEIIGETISAPADAYIDSWWSSSAGVMFGACGGLTLHWWKEVPDCPRKYHAHSAAVCALAAAALFAIDGLMAYCSAKKEDNENAPKYGCQGAK